MGEGEKITLTALQYRPDHIAEIICTEEWYNAHHEILASHSPTLADQREIAQLSSLRSKPPVAVVLRLPEPEELDWSTINRAIYLDDVQDPGNVGTIIRIADWYGVDAVIRSESSADYYNPKVIQSTMGSLLDVQLHTLSQSQLITTAKDHTLYATLMDGTPLQDITSKEQSILIMGNEGKGTSQLLIDAAHQRITIPGADSRVADSLNVAVSTGILAQRLWG